MSIEEHFANEAKSKKPRHFKEVVGKLLNERELEDPRPWKFEDEITENDWKEIMSALTDLRNEGSGAYGTPHEISKNFVELAAVIHTFDPARNLNINVQVKNNIERLRKNQEESNMWKTTAFLRLIDQSIEYQISDDRINEGYAIVDFRTRKKDAWLIGADQLALKILVPSLEIKIPPSVWNLKEWKNSDNIIGFAKVFASNRLVDPPSLISIDESLWDKMKEELNELRNKKLWFPFCQLAFNMRVLAAHKVEVTENGIECMDKQPTKLNVILPPRPIRKKKI